VACGSGYAPVRTAPGARRRYAGPVFSPQGPTVRELAVQALSSVQRGYDLLAPKFDRTPFRTPDEVLSAVRRALEPHGPFTSGLDVCTGTGAGVGLLRPLCREQVTGVDFSAGMLAVARRREGGPQVRWVRADVLALPFTGVFDLAVSLGAFGHFRPAELPRLFGQVHRALRPGGLFAFPMAAPPRVGSAAYWTLYGFDAAMRVRNALWRPPFVMYYRTFRFGPVLRELERAGFAVRTQALEELGRRADGSPRGRLILARKD
jgi:SAM-dependent methyltransferase